MHLASQYRCCSSIFTSGLFFSNQINFFEPVSFFLNQFNFCRSVFNQLSEKGPRIFGVWVKKQGLGFLGGVLRKRTRCKKIKQVNFCNTLSSTTSVIVSNPTLLPLSFLPTTPDILNSPLTLLSNNFFLFTNSFCTHQDLNLQPPDLLPSVLTIRPC